MQAPYEHHFYELPIRDSGRPAMRGLKDEPKFLLAVFEGRIVTLNFSINGKSSKLQWTPQIVADRMVAVTNVTLSQEARLQGFTLLEEWYNMEDAGARANYEQVKAWYAASRKRTSGKIATLNVAYLPKKLRSTVRAERKPTEVSLAPPQMTEEDLLDTESGGQTEIDTGTEVEQAKKPKRG